MKRTLTHAALALTLITLPALAAEDTDCYELSMTVSKAVTASPDLVLVTVQQQVAANPACSCEVVKAAIVASEADRQLVGQIVSTAVEAAPENLRIIAQCAIAVAPDALPEVQAVLAQLDPQGGETGSAKGGYAKGGYAKGAKGGKDVVPIVEVKPASPLDGPYLVPGIPFIHPPFQTPPSISDIGDIWGNRGNRGDRGDLEDKL
jgi:hypothetical protein